MTNGTGNTQDQKSLVNVLNRLAAVLESQKKSIDKISTTSNSTKSTSSKKSEPSWDYRTQLEAEQEIEETAEETLRIKQEIAQLYKDNTAATKALGTEEYRQLETSKVLASIHRQKLDLADKITEAYKKGNSAKLEELRTQEISLDAQRDQVKALKEQGKAQDKLNKKIKDSSKDLEKAITLIKNPLETLGKELEKNLIEKIKFSAAEADKAGKSVSGIGTAFKLVAGTAGIGLLIKGFSFIWDAIGETDERIVGLQRSFGLSRGEATKINDQFRDIASTTKVIGVNSKSLEEAYGDLANLSSVTQINNREMLEDQVHLKKQLGLTGEEAAEFQAISIGTGETTQKMLATVQESAKLYEQQTGDTVNMNKVTKMIAKTSKATLATFKGNAKELARSAVLAEKMGMSLEDAKLIGKNLLSIEDSLNAEMQANVLTGKHMNLNEARQLALKGKHADAAKEVLKQAGSYNELLNMEEYQRDAIAKAAGMTTDQLMKSAELAHISTKLGGKEVKSAMDLTDEELERLKIKGDITDEQVKTMQAERESATKAERWAKTQDKLKETLAKIADMIEPIVTKLFIGIEKFVDGIIDAKEAFKGMLPEGFKDLLKSDGAKTLAGGAALVGGAVGAFKLVKSYFKKKPEEEVADNTKRTADNTEGLGGGKNVGSSSAITEAGAGPEEGGSESGKKKGGMMSKLKNKFKNSKVGKYLSNSKAGKFFGKAGGFLGKAGGLLGKLGLSGMATDLVSNATGVDVGGIMDTVGGSSPKPSAPAGGGGGAGAAPKADDAAKKLAESSKAGQSSLTSSAPKATAPTAPKKGGGFFSKIGSWISEKASKLNPLNALKNLFKGPTLKKILSKIPKIGGIVSAAMSLGGAAASGGGNPQEVGKQIIMAIGDMGGTFLGGLLGSLIPGAGTMIGGFLGGYGGSALAGLIADNVDVSGIGKAAMTLFGSGDQAAAAPAPGGGASAGTPKPAAPSTASAKPSAPAGGGSGTSTAAVKSAAPAATASKTLTTTAAPTAAGSGAVATSGGSISETNSLLKQLIAKVDQPINMTIGTKAIGEISKQTAIQRSMTTKVDSSYGTFV